MLNVANHQGSANQNHNEVSFHTCQGGYHQKNPNNKCWQGCEEKGIFIPCWQGILWKIVWRFLKKLKIDLPYDSGISTAG